MKMTWHCICPEQEATEKRSGFMLDHWFFAPLKIVPIITLISSSAVASLPSKDDMNQQFDRTPNENETTIYFGADVLPSRALAGVDSLHSCFLVYVNSQSLTQRLPHEPASPIERLFQNDCARDISVLPPSSTPQP
jgi:hypothetical protein